MSLGIMLESLGMLSAIVQRAGEGEMERGAVADVDGDRDPLANLGHVGVGQHLALDAGEAPPGFAEFIVERRRLAIAGRSEEHTSELQSIMRISYAVFCLKKK